MNASKVKKNFFKYFENTLARGTLMNFCLENWNYPSTSVVGILLIGVFIITFSLSVSVLGIGYVDCHFNFLEDVVGSCAVEERTLFSKQFLWEAAIQFMAVTDFICAFLPYFPFIFELLYYNGQILKRLT